MLDAGVSQHMSVLVRLPGLINVMLCEHRRSLTLLDHFTLVRSCTR